MQPRMHPFSPMALFSPMVPAAVRSGRQAEYEEKGHQPTNQLEEVKISIKCRRVAAKAGKLIRGSLGVGLPRTGLSSETEKKTLSEAVGLPS